MWCVLLYKGCFSDFGGGGGDQLAIEEVCRIQTLPTVALACSLTCSGNTFVLVCCVVAWPLCSP